MTSQESKRATWNFPSNNFGQISGIADSGVETFIKPMIYSYLTNTYYVNESDY